MGPKLRKFQEWQQISEKRYYQGDINKNGQKDGQGILIEPSRLVISYWKSDKPHGSFTILFPDGVVQIGTFRDGKHHGQCTLTLTDGTTEKFKYDNGKPVE